MKQFKKKVLLAMSGGVDSSVAALLLQKQGYEVIGAFMKNWSDTKDPITGRCSWKEERKIAMKIASKINIPLITLDYEKHYRKLIIDEMYKNYKLGITPNPDVDCNNKLKFPFLIKEAKKRGIPLIATGHYARIKKTKKSFILQRAKQESKDQSYFLYRLSQNDLSNTLFPIGEFTKEQIREIAKKVGFPNYNKKSTTGICFIGKVNLKDFLKKKIKPKKGKILNPEGQQIGIHDGIYYYTIGQRIGPRFGIDIKKEIGYEQSMKKYYIAKKDAKKNIITVAPEGHKILYQKDLIIKSPHWINKTPKPGKYYARIRNVGELLSSKLSFKKGKYFLELFEPITGVSEGQAVVLYKGKDVIGGGIINYK